MDVVGACDRPRGRRGRAVRARPGARARARSAAAGRAVGRALLPPAGSRRPRAVVRAAIDAPRPPAVESPRAMKLLVYHARAETYRALLRERFPDLDVVAVVAGADDAALERHLPEAEVLLGWRIPVAELTRARRLRWIQLTSAGADHVLDARPDLGDVVLTNARGIHGEVMADY